MAPPTAPFWLERTADRGRHNDALAAAAGGRVGLEGVIEGLERAGRTARRSRLLRSPVVAGWRWDLRDELSRRWWPQGVTTSADAGAVDAGPATEELAGRRVVLTSSYSKEVGGVGHGARISVVDVTDPDRVRYQHVLLVKAVVAENGEGAGGVAGGVRFEPVHSHAGGLVWHGDHLHVAATAKGFHTFRLSDIVAAGGLEGHRGLEGHGHPYLLPTRFAHAARTEEGARAFRYSFLSSVREEGRVAVVAGEYAPPSGRGSTRLAEVTVDLTTGLPAVDEEGRVRPVLLGEGVRQAQGAVRAGGRWYVGTSNGRFRRGSTWVGPEARDGLEPRSFTRRAGVLPVGPEDLAAWPSRDELWTVTEYPGRRRLVVLDRTRLD